MRIDLLPTLSFCCSCSLFSSLSGNCLFSVLFLLAKFKWVWSRSVSCFVFTFSFLTVLRHSVCTQCFRGLRWSFGALSAFISSIKFCSVLSQIRSLPLTRFVGLHSVIILFESTNKLVGTESIYLKLHLFTLLIHSHTCAVLLSPDFAQSCCLFFFVYFQTSLIIFRFTSFAFPGDLLQIFRDNEFDMQINSNWHWFFFLFFFLALHFFPTLLFWTCLSIYLILFYFFML